MSDGVDQRKSKVVDPSITASTGFKLDRIGRCEADSVLNVPVFERVLDPELGIWALVGQDETAGITLQCGCAFTSKPGGLVASRAVLRDNLSRRSLTNRALISGFIRPRSASHVRSAVHSSVCKGRIVAKPFPDV